MAVSIPESFINQLLSKVDIIDVIGTRVPLKKSGANYLSRCPFHQEKTPSFSVNAVKQFYYCFGCGAKGDIIQFLIEYEGIGFVDAIETLASLAGLEVPKQHPKIIEHKYTKKNQNNNQQNIQDNVPHEAHQDVKDDEQYSKETNDVGVDKIYSCLEQGLQFFKQNLNKNNDFAMDAIKYLQNRGIDGITAKKFNLGYATSSWDNLLKFLRKNYSVTCMLEAGLIIKVDKNSQPSSADNIRYYDRFRDRIIFPIRNRRGKTIAFGGRVIAAGEPKYLNSPETSVFNKSKELFGLFEAQSELKFHKNIIVVEGYLDVISLWQYQVKNAVATLGTAITEQHVRLLFNLKDEIIFCFDGDLAGQKACWRALELCLPMLDGIKQVKFLLLPNTQDPDSFIRANGTKEFLTLVERAMSLYDFMFYKLSKDLDLEHIEGKTSLIARIKPLLAIIKINYIKEMLFERLAQITKVDKNLLQQDLTNSNNNNNYNYNQNNFKAGSSYKASSFSGRNTSRSNTRVQQISPALRASALLLFNRDLINLIQPETISLIQGSGISGAKLLLALITVIKDNIEIKEEEIAKLLSVDCAKFFNIKELQSMLEMIPKNKEAIDAEFNYDLAFLKKEQLRESLDEMLALAKDHKLTDEQILELQEMLTTSKSE